MPAIDPQQSLVYLVDDEPVNVRLLETILRNAGMTRLRSFENGRALLDSIAVEEPDVILLDLRMPGLDGYQVLGQLRERQAPDAYVPVLVLTADATRESRDAALRLGANDYLTKPFDAAEVVLRVRNLLRTRRLHEALRARNAELAGQVESAARTLDDREREWAEHVARLTAMEARDSVEATAQAVCDELSRLPRMTTVLVVAIDAGGHAVPLARNEYPDVRVGINRPLPMATTNLWRQRLAGGPWIGPWEAVFDGPEGVAPFEPTAMVVIPLRISKGSLGAIVAGTDHPDGQAYLAERLALFQSFGAIASALLAPGILARQRRSAVRADLEDVITQRSFASVFQPIVELEGGGIVGYEALTRFEDGTRPDRRFADANAVGLGLELEVACLQASGEAAASLPRECWLSVNVSPALLFQPDRLKPVLDGFGRPAVLEVTEHVAIDDYKAFRKAAHSLGAGIRFAVDDAGAGYASFRHILELRPDFVKLDILLVRRIDADEVRQALVAGIVYFARTSGCRLIAEGIETARERDRLRALGVDLGQGYLLGRPTRAPDVLVHRADGGVPSRSVGVAAPRAS